MNEIEIKDVKSQVFDIIKELENLQVKANELNTQKNELLKKLEPTE